jgi:hypothetical protein
VAALVEWCDRRLAFYQSVAEWTAPQRYTEREFSEEHRAEMLKKIADLPKTVFSKIPTDDRLSVYSEPPEPVRPAWTPYTDEQLRTLYRPK